MTNEYIKSAMLHHEFCPLDTTIKIISGRWKSIIICRLMSGNLRFNELCRSIPDCTRRMLAIQIKELTEANIICKKIESDSIGYYELTELGLTLVPVIKSLNAWGLNYLHNSGKKSH